MSSVGSAGAAAPGVGTSQASTTVLSVKLGDVLGLKVLGDEARSTIDRQLGDPSAYSRLVGVDITSKLLPALNVSVPAAPIESRSPGGQPTVTVQNQNVSSGIQGIAVPASVATGILDATLRSSLDPLAARSGIDGVVKNLSLAGGLLDVGEVSSTVATGAAQQISDGVRSVKVGSISVLDLGAVLDGLGLTLADLPISTVSSMLSQLGVPVAGLPAGTSLSSYVTALSNAIDQVQATVNSSTNQVTGTVDSTVAGVLGQLNLSVPSTSSTVSQVMTTVDGLQSTLVSTLQSAIQALDGMTLLKADGLDVSVATKAVDNVKDSAATITAKLGAVHVGGITVPGVDLLSAASQINGLVSSVNSTLSGALGAISPDLANLVSVSVLDQVKSVTSENGYVRSRAGITGLTASIVPPANLDAIVSTVKSATGIGDALATLGGTVPATSTAMSTLEGALGTAVQALASGGVIKVAEVAAASDFAPAGGVPVEELPRTGGTPLAAIGLLLAAAGLGVRRAIPMIARPH